MATTILIPEKDPMGAAISDFFNLHRADRLRVFSSQFEEDEIPVKELFRSMPSMPMLERTALQMATGQILDVGAGSGCPPWHFRIWEKRFVPLIFLRYLSK